MNISALPRPTIADWGPVVLHNVHDLPASTFDEDAEVVVREGKPISHIPMFDSAHRVSVRQAPVSTWDESYVVQVVPGIAPLPILTN